MRLLQRLIHRSTRTCLLLAGWMLSTATYACDTGLVLGGGGARGAAHVGILKVLEREQIAVDCIAGTSMGAIVGGLYAAGYKADDIERILTSVDWRDLFRDDPPRRELPLRRKQTDLDLLIDLEIGFDRNGLKPPRGILQGEKLFLMLRRNLVSTTAVNHFDDLPIPYRAVAAELATGDGVVFEDGDLATAIRASMSVPGFFQPVRVKGKLLVDGGIHDNVPVIEVHKMGARRLIVVDVGSPLLEEEQLSSPLAVTNQVIAAMMVRQTRATLELLDTGDLLIRPDLGKVGPASFDRTVEAIAAGERAAEAHIEGLRTFRSSPERYARFVARHRVGPFANPALAFIEVDGSRSRTAPYVADRLAQLKDKPIDFDRLDDVLKRIYGEGRYERIGYDLIEHEGQTGIRVQPVDKGWGPNFLRFGLSLSDDFAGNADYRLGVEARVTGLTRSNMEWRSRIDLGGLAGLGTELNIPFGQFRQFYVEPGLRVDQEQRPLGFQRTQNTLAEYRVRRRTLDLEVGYDHNEHLRFYGRLLRGDDRATLQVGDPGEVAADLRSDAGGALLGFLRDSLDDASFPTAGSRTQVQYTHHLTRLGADINTRLVEADWDKAWSVGMHRFIAGLHGSDVLSDGLVLRAASRIGGLGNLSGYSEGALVGERTALGRLVYYRSFDDGTRLFTLPVYLGATLETGLVQLSGVDADRNWITAGSVFFGADTPLGPIYLGFGRADTGEDSFYLRFGSLIRNRDSGF